MARRLGATEGMLDGVARGEYGVFEASWQSAMRFADELTPTPGVVSDRTYASLASHWNAQQIVEITTTVCLFAFFNRFAHALDIPVTR